MIECMHQTARTYNSRSRSFWQWRVSGSAGTSCCFNVFCVLMYGDILYKRWCQEDSLGLIAVHYIRRCSVYRRSSVVCLSVCLSVCQSVTIVNLYKPLNRSRCRLQVADSGGPEEPCIGRRIQIPHARGPFWGKGAAHRKLYVTLCRELRKNGWTDRDGDRHVDSGGPKEACIRRR